MGSPSAGGTTATGGAGAGVLSPPPPPPPPQADSESRAASARPAREGGIGKRFGFMPAMYRRNMASMLSKCHFALSMAMKCSLNGYHAIDCTSESLRKTSKTSMKSMKNKRRLPLAAALLCVLAASGARAGDDEPISADRPGVAESSQVVGKGRLQLETSLQWERERGDDLHTRTLSTPTLLRIGVGETTELRIETD